MEMEFGSIFNYYNIPFSIRVMSRKKQVLNECFRSS